jgi:hypothetical protein
MQLPLNFIRNFSYFVHFGRNGFDPSRDDYYCNIFTREAKGVDVALVPHEDRIYKSNCLPKGKATMEAPREALWRVSPSRKSICSATDEELCMAMYKSPKPFGGHVLAVHLARLSSQSTPGEFEVTPSGVGGRKAKIFYRDEETHCGAFPCALTTNFEGGLPQLLITSEDRTFKIKNILPVDGSAQQQ